jgi:hypothetical protein
MFSIGSMNWGRKSGTDWRAGSSRNSMPGTRSAGMKKKAMPDDERDRHPHDARRSSSRCSSSVISPPFAASLSLLVGFGFQRLSTAIDGHQSLAFSRSLSSAPP